MKKYFSRYHLYRFQRIYCYSKANFWKYNCFILSSFIVIILGYEGRIIERVNQRVTTNVFFDGEFTEDGLGIVAMKAQEDLLTFKQIFVQQSDICRTEKLLRGGGYQNYTFLMLYCLSVVWNIIQIRALILFRLLRNGAIT